MNCLPVIMEDTLGNKVCRVVMRMLYIVSICFHMESEVRIVWVAPYLVTSSVVFVNYP